MGLAFSLSIPPVFAVRVLLGFAESIVGPGLLAITVQWFVKEEQPLIGAAWQSKWTRSCLDPDWKPMFIQVCSVPTV